MQPQRRDVYGTITGLLLDSALVGVCCVYGHVLEAYKDPEPDMTWLEVAAGVGLCLGQAELSHRWAGTPYRVAVWRAFFLGAPPIVVGELKQAVAAYHKRKNRKLPDPNRPRYRDLVQ